MIRYLNYNYIVQKNIDLIIKKGGCIDLAGKVFNQNSFYYLIDIVKNDNYYPSIFEKAGLYAHNIIKNHIFHDGNKRTGTFCALSFLQRNKYFYSKQISNEEIIEFAHDIINNKIDLKDIANWLKERFTL